LRTDSSHQRKRLESAQQKAAQRKHSREDKRSRRAPAAQPGFARARASRYAGLLTQNEPHQSWLSQPPRLRRVNSIGLGILALTMFSYAIATLNYAAAFGFALIDILYFSGLSALMFGGGVLLMSANCWLILASRYGYGRSWSGRWRALWFISAALLLGSFGLMMLEFLIGRRIGAAMSWSLSARADWPLAPTHWTWPLMIRYAQASVKGWIFGAGFVCLMLLGLIARC
jgi:hypothetical protein